MTTEDHNDLGLKYSRAVKLDSSLHEPLNQCISNINWFSSRYGEGYGEIEVVAHYGGPRSQFRFSGALNTIRLRDGEPFTSRWTQAEVTQYLKDNKFDGGSAISKDGLTLAQSAWLRHDDQLGSNFKINASWHYHDRALDIYWVGWKHVSNGAGIVRHAARPCFGRQDVNSSTQAYRRLVAVEAGLRKWFGGVLNRNWDVNESPTWPAHWSHFHIDNGSCVDLRLLEYNSEPLSDVMFIQSCIEAFTDVSLSDDGTHFGFYGRTRQIKHREQGRLTKEGYEVLLSDLGMESLDPQTNVNHYYLLLDYIMMHGFANERAGAFRWAGWESNATSPPA